MVHKKTLSVAAGIALFSIAAHSETFTWKHISKNSGYTPPASPNWQAFGDPANWKIGDKDSGTVENTASLVPGAADTLYLGKFDDYLGKSYCFDLGGILHTVSGISGGTSQWNPYLMLLKNGTLEFVESFTNNATHVHVYEKAKFVLGGNSKNLLGSPNLHSVFHVYEDGEVDFGGVSYFVNFQMIVDYGGKVTFHPSKFAFYSSANVKHDGNCWIVSNSGTFDLPDGFLLEGQWTADGPCVFVFEQKNGVLNVGGNFEKSEMTDGQTNRNFADFVLEGGTINASADVSFVRFRNVVMTNDAVATVNVAEGKTLDLSVMKFMPGTVLAKTGKGTVKFGDSVPDVLNVEGGVIDSIGHARFGVIDFSPETELWLNAAGVSARVVNGIENVKLTVGENLIASRKPIFRVDNEEVAETMAQMISVPEGYTTVINSGTLTVERSHAPSVFYWKHENSGSYYPFYDPSAWGVGKTADSANEGEWIPGEDDDIYYGNAYQRYLHFDMNGGTRKVRSLCDGLSPAANEWGFCYIGVKNGSLEFTSCFTNGRAHVTVADTGRFVLGENCGAQMGKGGMNSKCTVESGGECVMAGNLSIHRLDSSVKSGGKMVFRPSEFTFSSLVNTKDYTSHIDNCGLLELPDGISIGGPSYGGGCVLLVRQSAGEMVLGGNVENRSPNDHLDFNLTGGVVRVTGDAAFAGCRNVVMVNGVAAEISVAPEKLADFSAMEFMEGTALAKTGAGSLKLGASAPASLSVESGELVIGGSAAFGSGLSLGGRARLRFAGAGASADSIAGIDGAEFAVDASAVKYGTVLLESGNAELMETLAERLAPLVLAATDSCRTVAVKAADGEEGILKLTVVSNCGLKVILR